MSLSKLIGILWVLAVSVFIRGWVSTHSVATTWVIVVLGIAYAVVCVLEWLGIITFALHGRKRTAAATPGDPVV
jgi:hypothetical protein